MPATASIIAHQTGCINAFCFDVQVACTGFLLALETASNYIKSGKYSKIIVVAGDKMRTVIDPHDRSTSPLFGDGCAAILLEATNENLGLIDSTFKTDGSGVSYLIISGNGSANPVSKESIEKREQYLYQDGKYVFKHAVESMPETTKTIVKRNNLSSNNIDWLVPHQANLRIIHAIAKRLDLSIEKVMINIQKYGNTSAGTIPICLWEWEKKLKKGDNLIMSAFGAGFTWGSVYLKWGYDSN